MVNYTEYKHNIKSGDLLLWRTTKVSSIVDIFLVLVQKILNTKYSHVGIAVVIGDRYLVIEANYPRVRLIPISNTKDFFHLPLKIKYLRKYDDFLFQKLGLKYSLIDVFSYMLRIKNNKDTYYCTELAADFYSSIGLLDTDEAGIDPKMLSELLIEIAKTTPIPVKLDKANF